MAGVVGRQELPNEDAHAPRSRHGRPRSKKPAALLLSDFGAGAQARSAARRIQERGGSRPRVGGLRNSSRAPSSAATLTTGMDERQWRVCAAPGQSLPGDRGGVGSRYRIRTRSTTSCRYHTGRLGAGVSGARWQALPGLQAATLLHAVGQAWRVSAMACTAISQPCGQYGRFRSDLTLRPVDIALAGEWRRTRMSPRAGPGQGILPVRHQAVFRSRANRVRDRGSVRSSCSRAPSSKPWCVADSRAPDALGAGPGHG